MSHAALCQAVCAKLRTTFSLDANSCEVGFDGTPSPMAGQFYVAIHPLAMGGISGDYDLGEEMQVGVTLSIRLGVTPRDRRGIAVWLDQSDSTGLHQRVRKVITAIHHQEDIRNAANSLITTADAIGGGLILTPLWFLSLQPPQIRSYQWFSAAPPPSTQMETDDAGVSQTIVFGKCQRVQSIPDMD